MSLDYRTMIEFGGHGGTVLSRRSTRAFGMERENGEKRLKLAATSRQKKKSGCFGWDLQPKTKRPKLTLGILRICNITLISPCMALN